MAKPKSSGTPETKRSTRDSSVGSAAETAATRIDPPHEMTRSVPESPLGAPSPAPEPSPEAATEERIRLQADQLAMHLRRRQEELDHREAELNSQIARFESEARAARLWLAERESELAAGSEGLAKRQQEIEDRLERLAAEETRRQTQASESTAEKAGTEKKEEELRRMAEELATQEKRLKEAELRLAQRWAETKQLEKQLSHQQQSLEEEAAAMRRQMMAEQRQAVATGEDEQRRTAEALAAQERRRKEAETRLVESQAEAERFQKQLSQQRKALQDETEALRQQMIAEHRQAMDELSEKRQAVQRRADHLDQSRAALKQLRTELGRMHRETLEIRLSTEELWVQLSGAAPPAALDPLVGTPPHQTGRTIPSGRVGIGRPAQSARGRPRAIGRATCQTRRAEAGIRAMGHRPARGLPAAGVTAVRA